MGLGPQFIGPNSHEKPVSNELDLSADTFLWVWATSLAFMGFYLEYTLVVDSKPTVTFSLLFLHATPGSNKKPIKSQPFFPRKHYSNVFEIELRFEIQQADNVPEGRRASAFGILSGISSCGFVCGTLTARFLPTASTFQVIFFFLCQIAFKCHPICLFIANFRLRRRLRWWHWCI